MRSVALGATVRQPDVRLCNLRSLVFEGKWASFQNMSVRGEREKTTRHYKNFATWSVHSLVRGRERREVFVEENIQTTHAERRKRVCIACASPWDDESMRGTAAHILMAGNHLSVPFVTQKYQPFICASFSFLISSIAPLGTTLDGRYITSSIGFQWTPTTTSCPCTHR